MSSLLNEPIIAQGVFWSSVKGNAYSVPFRILSFERMHTTRDPDYSLPAVQNYATKLRDSVPAASAPGLYQRRRNRPRVRCRLRATTRTHRHRGDASRRTACRHREGHLRRGAGAEVTKPILQGNGIPWGVLMGNVKAVLPASLQQDNNRVNRLIVEIVTRIVGGPQDEAWKTEQRTVHSGRSVRFIVRC